MADKPIDVLNLYLNDGMYGLIICRGDDPKKRVKSILRNHFDEIILDILDYDGKGLMYRNAKEAGHLITSGSIYDRGTNNPPDFNEWILETKCHLPSIQKKNIRRPCFFS